MSPRRCPTCKRTMPATGPEFVTGREDGMTVPCDHCKKDVEAYWIIGRYRICDPCYQKEAPTT